MLMSSAVPLSHLENESEFIARHIGISEADEHHMLSVIGEASRRALIDSIVPRSIARTSEMAIPPPVTEAQALAESFIAALPTYWNPADGWAIERLRHDEHINAATLSGILNYAFCIQLSDSGGNPSIERQAYDADRQKRWPQPPTLPPPSLRAK